MLAVLFCALVGAVLNRFSGWTNQSWIPGRHIYWAALVATLLTWELVGPWWAAAVALSVLYYRLPGWYGSLDMGTHADSLSRDARVMFVCTLRIAPVFVFALFRGVLLAPALLLTAAAGAVAIYILGNLWLVKYTKDPFRYIEPGVGAVIGAMIGLLFVL